MCLFFNTEHRFFLQRDQKVQQKLFLMNCYMTFTFRDRIDVQYCVPFNLFLIFSLLYLQFTFIKPAETLKKEKHTGVEQHEGE